MRRFVLLISIFITALVTGCSTVPFMPLADDGQKLDPAKPLFLMSVVLKNDIAPRWKPRVITVVLDKAGVADKQESIAFRMDEKGAIQSTTTDGLTTYLVRFSADENSQTVRGFRSIASAFPLHGYYFVPLHADVPKTAGGVYYLGAIRGVIRNRKGDEFKAGPVVPLIDQAITGASGGTFDIEISDAYSVDVELFKKTFVALKDVEIKKSLLPEWDRTKAQMMWEKE